MPKIEVIITKAPGGSIRDLRKKAADYDGSHGRDLDDLHCRSVTCHNTNYIASGDQRGVYREHFDDSDQDLTDAFREKWNDQSTVNSDLLRLHRRA
jgi:hypothetical protein